MTPHEKIAAVYAALALLAAGIGWGFHWWVLDVRYWLPFGLRRQAPDYLPGPAPSMPAPGAGEHHDFDVYAFEDWEQLDPDQAADQLIAEWHGGVWHDAEGRTEQDLWDQWWEGVDGLERECMLVHDDFMRFYDTEAAHLAECGVSEERIREMCAA